MTPLVWASLSHGTLVRVKLIALLVWASVGYDTTSVAQSES